MRPVAALFLIGAFAFGCVSVQAPLDDGHALSPSPTTGYILDLDLALTPRMTADEAVVVAMTSLAAMARGAANANLATSVDPRIIKVSLRRASDARSVESSSAGDPTAKGLVWIVRAEGTFLTNRGLGPPRVWPSGYFIIDDATGGILGDGMP
jgi:hypothetical protein